MSCICELSWTFSNTTGNSEYIYEMNEKMELNFVELSGVGRFYNSNLSVTYAIEKDAIVFKFFITSKT